MDNSCQVTSSFLLRLPYNEDLLTWLGQLCRERDIKLGTVSLIGALKKATLAYYHQDRKQYESTTYDTPLEIVSCLGNISLREEQPFVHLHAVLSNDKGQTLAGHLISPSIIFAAEAFLQQLEGKTLVRAYDEITGLHLWQAG